MDSEYLNQLGVVGEAGQREAIRLASFFCPRHAVAICARAAKNWSEDSFKRLRREWRSDTHYVLCFPDDRVDRVALQLHIQWAAVQHVAEPRDGGGCRIPRAQARWWALYLANFASSLLAARTPVRVAEFFNGVLAGGQPQKVRQLCRVVAPTGVPDVTLALREGYRVEHLREACERFAAVFETEGDGLKLEEVAKSDRPEVSRVLEKLTPVNHQHVKEGDGGPGERSSESETKKRERLALAELSIEQGECLARVQRWSPDLVGAFDKWRLPLCRDEFVDPHDDPWDPPPLPDWPMLRRELFKEILMLEWETSNGATAPGQRRPRFAIVVDGRPMGYFQRGRQARFNVPPSARFLEVRHGDSGVSVANCHLIDPADLPDRGVKASTKLVAGGSIDLAFYPDRRPISVDSRSGGTLVEVRHRVGVMDGITTVLADAIEVLRPRPGRLRRFGRAAIISLRRVLEILSRWFRRPSPWVQPIAIGILLVVLGSREYVYMKQRAGDQARISAVATLAEESRDAARLRAGMHTSGAEGVAPRLEVGVAAVGGRAYPFPSLRKQSSAVTSLIAQEAARSPLVKVSYEAYLWQWSEILRALGGTLAEAGKIPEATAVFEYLVEASGEPESHAERERLLGLLYGLGELTKMKGDHRAAVHVYDMVIARGLAPSDPRPAHYAGWSSYELGDYDAARRYYEAALRIDPGYAKVYYNLALVFRDLGQERLYRENLDKAVKLTTQAHLREGDANPRIPFSLAILATAQGKLDEALEVLERALQADRLYVVRAENERAFGVFRDRVNEPHFSRFRALLDRYRPPRTGLGGPSGPYNPSIFNE